MATSWQADSILRMPSTANQGHYKRNYLQQTVCELRFPTLMGLGDARPPEKFANALRKAYPIYGLVNEVTVNIGMPQHAASLAHQFKTANGHWAVSLKSNALTLETGQYTKFEDLLARLMTVLDAAMLVIDSDFFTRVGLRYINVVKTSGGLDMTSWVNPQLVQPLGAQLFTGIAEYNGRLQLATPDGGLLLQHGLAQKQEAGPAGAAQASPLPNYVIDIDVFRNEVAASDVALALQRGHDQAFTLFDWSLGPLAKAHLADQSV